ncbi:CBS domain-containing protein [Ideonella sp.]|uniref:CBS domain-containing protein n=1 Tax=Ideonella sp. TaxID=1929293 RepID=UPI002B4982D5|nr:CBS domain-containing protein [Ideonella sp.]HJV67676.1 CBS domain-containing protein [Ideonella sp.]
MKTAAQILKSKPDQTVYTLGPHASAHEAARLMADKNIGALVVVEQGQVVGMVSERDYVRKLVFMSHPPTETAVADIMSSPVMYVHPHRTSDECRALMTENRMRHLPVMDGNQLVGVVSIGDLVKDTISEQQFIIEQLEHYITGQRD